MSERGFTLLEALVTLVIVAMVATLLMQSLTQVLGLRDRVLRNDREARVAALHERWFRESIAAAVAELPDSPEAFRGDAEGVRFLSLDAPDGARHAVVEWRLQPESDGRSLGVRIGTEAADRPLLRAIDARFRYLDAHGRWHGQWPPTPDPKVGSDVLRDDVALPRAVELQFDDAIARRLWRVELGAGAGLPQPLRVREEIRNGAL